MRKPQIKMLKTRANNARIRADKVKERAAVVADCAAIDAKRAKAYGEMENSVCDIARAGELAMTVFDNDRLFLFAVGQLDFMVQRFKDRYYAEEFPGDN